MAIEFDCANWSIVDFSITCAPANSASPRALGGFQQIVRTANHRWRGSVSLNPIEKDYMVNYRGFITSLEGRANSFDLCICDPSAVNLDASTSAQAAEALGYDVSTLCGPINGVYGEPFSDGTCFSDGAGFSIPATLKAPTAQSAANAGEASINLDEAAGYLLSPGSYFSTSDNYLHQVTSVVNAAPSGRIFSFLPPLRRAISQGEAIETASPKIKVRLADDESGTPTVSYGRRISNPGFRFEEVLER